MIESIDKNEILGFIENNIMTKEIIEIRFEKFGLDDKVIENIYDTIIKIVILLFKYYQLSTSSLNLIQTILFIQQ